METDKVVAIARELGYRIIQKPDGRLVCRARKGQGPPPPELSRVLQIHAEWLKGKVDAELAPMEYFLHDGRIADKPPRGMFYYQRRKGEVGWAVMGPSQNLEAPADASAP